MRTSVRFVLTTGLTCAALAACDGSTGPGVPTPIAFESLDGGDGHMCGLTADGDAYCWGSDTHGQLGSGDGESHNAPTPVAGGLEFAMLSAGSFHTCGVTTAGDAYCWGANGDAQLGDGTIENRSAPVLVGGDHTFASISAGTFHSCGLTPSGNAHCWGSDANGQLGDGASGETRGEPMPVTGDRVFATISAGSRHTCALVVDGTAYCWGSNDDGQLGTGASGLLVPTPTVAASGIAFARIDASRHSYTCGVALDGTAYCWGHNDFAQLGRDTVSRELPDVAPISSGLTFQEIYGHSFHSCAIASDGSAHCWGKNSTGELGDGTDVSLRQVPVPVAGGLRFRSLTLGMQVTCGITTDDVPYCWGLNFLGQFGNGETSDVPATEPVLAAGH